MTQDYPDWTRLMHLVGTNITIPIRIEASEVTIPVSIAASDVTLNVYLGSMPFETTAENLLTNPGFEDGDLTGWDTGSTGTVTVQSDEVWKGTYACKLEAPISGVASVSNSEQIPCYPGQRVLVAAGLKADANIDMSKLIVHFRSAEGVYLQTSFSPDYGNNYDWTPKTHTFVAPDGAAFALPGAYFTAGDPAGVGYADSFIAARLVQPALDSSLNLNINIVAQDIAALDINIAASAITVNINFLDQSVAVFDIIGWAAREAEDKTWHIAVTVAAMGTNGVDVYTVPAGKKLYLLRYLSSVGAIEAHIVSYKTPSVILFDGVVAVNTPVLLPFSPPQTIVAGKTLRVDWTNGDNTECMCKATLQAYELSV